MFSVVNTKDLGTAMNTFVDRFAGNCYGTSLPALSLMVPTNTPQMFVTRQPV